MPSITKAGKLYKMFLESLSAALGRSGTQVMKEARPVKWAMREFKPEAYEELKTLIADKSLPTHVTGQQSGALIQINPRGGLNEQTVGHELGHHLMYRDFEHPLGRFHRSTRWTDFPEAPEVKKLIEYTAEDFGKIVQDRSRTGQRYIQRPKLKETEGLMKWLKSLALMSALGIKAESQDGRD